jgi:hypothetical protein
MMYDVPEALTVNIPLKIFVCFLLSALVLVGMAFYFYESIVNEPVELSMLVAVFLTLFLFFFFCFNMRQATADKIEALAGLDEEEPVIQDYVPELPSLSNHENEELEELEAVEPELGSPELGSDIPDQKTIFVNQSHVSNVRLAFGDDDIPYLVESSGLELVDGDLGEIVSFIQGAEPTEPEEILDTIPVEEAELEELPDVPFVAEAEPAALFPLESIIAVDGVAAENDVVSSNDGIEAVELEDISMGFDASIIIFKQPFAYSLSNPELLHGAASQVIYEQNGIHFINTHFDGEGIDRVLDSNFAKLVESVLSSSSPRD